MNNAISNARPAGTDSGTLTELPRPPILAREDASRRAALLADLQTALAAQGVSSVLARNHRLVLRGGRTRYQPATYEPSGPTDPQLHIFTPDGTDIATTRGATYHFASGRAHPVADPAQAARLATQTTAR